MGVSPIRVYIKLETIDITPSGWTIGGAFLWTVFFKIDGDTVSLDSNLRLQGSATVKGTPGNHGDLPSNVPNSVAIPESLGTWATLLKPIPVPGFNTSIGGAFGCVAILLDQQNTPDADIAAGHDALNSALQQQLDTLIPTFGLKKTQVTQDDITTLENNVTSAIKGAVTDSLGIGHKILTFLGFENQDSLIMTAPFNFGASSLTNVPASGMPLQQRQSFTAYFAPAEDVEAAQSSETATPGAYMVYDPLSPPKVSTYNWAINGTLYADSYPLSLRRIFTELGDKPPFSLRTAMRPYNTGSVLAWASVAGG